MLDLDVLRPRGPVRDDDVVDVARITRLYGERLCTLSGTHGDEDLIPGNKVLVVVPRKTDTAGTS
ncbi:MAG: hypothetical protein F4059_09835 [Gemmatimonadetes bacterium]|nr:hypothetical protein [Gemmatimonadota bacterium]